MQYVVFCRIQVPLTDKTLERSSVTWWFENEDGFLLTLNEIFMEGMAYRLREGEGQKFDPSYYGEWYDQYQDVIDWVEKETGSRSLDDEEVAALLFGMAPHLRLEERKLNELHQKQESYQVELLNLTRQMAEGIAVLAKHAHLATPPLTIPQIADLAKVAEKSVYRWKSQGLISPLADVSAR